jgi:hypothetical protein
LYESGNGDLFTTDLYISGFEALEATNFALSEALEASALALALKDENIIY